jgi:hypothetical protein
MMAANAAIWPRSNTAEAQTLPRRGVPSIGENANLAPWRGLHDAADAVQCRSTMGYETR